MPADAVHAGAGEYVAIALDHADAIAVVERHEPGQRLHFGRPPEGRRAAVGPGPERHFLLLDPDLRAREEAMAGPVIVVEMGDEAEGHVGRLDPRALDH